MADLLADYVPFSKASHSSHCVVSIHGLVDRFSWAAHLLNRRSVLHAFIRITTIPKPARISMASNDGCIYHDDITHYRPLLLYAKNVY